MAVLHGSRSRYVQGCRCGRCKSAEAAYRRSKRAKDQGVTISTEVVNSKSGCVEAAVRQELGLLSAATLRPGLSETLLEMARLLDDPRYRTSHASAARQIQMGLERIRAQSTTKSAYSEVAAMLQEQKENAG